MTAINLSKHIIKAGVDSGIADISNKKLQKLLYYVQAWTLVLYGKKAFNDDIEAWVHGPAIPSVYRAYKDFAFNPIPASMADAIQPISSEIQSVLKDVLRVYGKYDASYLETLTHVEQPWQEARGSQKPYENSVSVISTASMKSYYGKKISETKS